MPDSVGIAKLENTLLGGTWGDPPQREAAERIRRMYPGRKTRTRDAPSGGEVGRQLLAVRAVHAREAVRAVAGGAAGVVFAGFGYPHDPHPHAEALERRPDARFAYIDPNVRIAAVNRVNLGRGQVTACAGSLRDPGALMALPAVRAIGRPVQLQAHLAAHWWEPGTARELVAAYAELMSPGDELMLSLVIPGPGRRSVAFGAVITQIAGAQVCAHAPGDVESWFAGTGMVLAAGGVTDVETPGRSWAGMAAAPRAPGRAVYVAARKPS